MNIHKYNKELITHSFKEIYSKLKYNKILLTGGTGYLGKNILYTLNLINIIFKTQIEVDIICRKRKIIFNKNFYYKKNIKIKFLYLDLSNRIPKFNKNYDVVIHLADNSTSEDTNSSEIVKNYKNLIKSLLYKNKTTFILLSSGAVYQQYKNKIYREDSPLIDDKKNNNGYDRGKLLTEIDILSKKRIFKKIIILRGFTFVGQYFNSKKHFFISQLLKSLKNKKKKLNISSDGYIYRSYLYTIDAATIIIKSIFFAKNDTYNLGSNEYFSIRDVEEIVKKNFDQNFKFNYLNAIPKPYKRAYYLPNINKTLNHFKINKLTKLERSMDLLLKN